jgi:hypothetical protein
VEKDDDDVDLALPVLNPPVNSTTSLAEENK